MLLAVLKIATKECNALSAALQYNSSKHPPPCKPTSRPDLRRPWQTDMVPLVLAKLFSDTAEMTIFPELREFGNWAGYYSYGPRVRTGCFKKPRACHSLVGELTVTDVFLASCQFQVAWHRGELITEPEGGHVEAHVRRVKPRFEEGARPRTKMKPSRLSPINPAGQRSTPNEKRDCLQPVRTVLTLPSWAAN